MDLGLLVSPCGPSIQYGPGIVSVTVWAQYIFSMDMRLLVSVSLEYICKLMPLLAPTEHKYSYCSHSTKNTMHAANSGGGGGGWSVCGGISPHLLQPGMKLAS